MSLSEVDYLFYNVAVSFIGGGSAVNLFEVKRLWALPILQVRLLLILAHYTSRDWKLFYLEIILCFWYLYIITRAILTAL
jgi:hypothetical protein